MIQMASFLSECRVRTLLADGAMGTELQRAGLAPGEPGEGWNLERPDAIEAIHRAYLEAGSDAIITNTFGANPWVLARYDLADRLDEINRRAVAIARRAAGPGRFVLGDIGPSGGFLHPLGDLVAEDLQRAFERQAAALLAGGADGIIIETMSAIEEVVIGVRAARASGAAFVIASMAFDRLPNGAIRTMMGVAPEQAATAFAEAGADVVGANCGTKLAVEDFARVAAGFRSAVTLPLMIQPNAGQPELVDGRAVYRLSPPDYAAAMRAVLAAGANIVGGCCGTTPAHIAAVSSMLGARSTGA
jgi:5-methyltetrahydrofolate--homocysteine methyltransferase